MKKIYFAFFVLLLIASSEAKGQFSTRQAGLRMGYRSGIFYQASHDAGSAEIAYNAMLSFRKNGVQFTGLKIVYETTLDRLSSDLYFGWGYGGHVGFVYSDHLRSMGEEYYFNGDHFCPLIGVDGWLAAEYRVHEIPLNISLNVKPYVELTIPSFVMIVPWDFAVSISYVF
jgi:hypothetical protein